MEVETTVQRTLLLSKMKMFMSLNGTETNLPCEEDEVELLLKETKENLKLINSAKKNISKKSKKSEDDGTKTDLENFLNELADIEKIMNEIKRKLKTRVKSKGKGTFKRTFSKKFNDLFTTSESKRLTTSFSSRKLSIET